ALVLFFSCRRRHTIFSRDWSSDVCSSDLAEEKVFTAWNPFLMRDRFNLRESVSLYSRFSIQKLAKTQRIAAYRDTNDQSVISFRSEERRVGKGTRARGLWCII